MTKLLWAFVAWTLFVWFTRLNNVFGDGTLSDSETIRGAAIALAFVVVAASIPLVAVGANRFIGTYASIVAVITAAWWTVRLFTNLFGDGSAGFKVVHTLLSIVAVGLSVAVLRWHTSRVRIPTKPETAGSI